MAGELVNQSYGKHRVRVSKVRRPRRAAAKDEIHELVEVSVDIELEGDFDAAYTASDNRKVIATDTCKNTVYVIAKDDPLDSIETFGLAIASHFVETYPQVSFCKVRLCERVWNRLLESPHSFVAAESMTPTATVAIERDEMPRITAGLENLLIAKTTESGFSNFDQSEYRTLADTDDRILATQVTADWDYVDDNFDFSVTRKAIVDALLARFIDHYSHSVQETLYFMGQAALDACNGVERITLTLPNKHHLLADLSPFGRENENEVFVVTDEPFGYITATVSR